MEVNRNLPRLVVIAGPTASGKSSLAFHLARKFHGEILSADSMQVYRKMNIGTAKPSREQRAAIPHHLIDLVEPDGDYSAARFREEADPIITRLHREKTPIFVAGGSGLYLKALTRGLFRGPGADPEIRKALRERIEREGILSLYGELQTLDPLASSRIHKQDAFRIIRALEVYAQIRKPISRFQGEHGFRETPYAVLKIGLLRDREELYGRIDRRVDEMIGEGWVGEVRSLLQQGYSRELKSMKSLGYRHLTAYLGGETGMEEAVSLIKRDTRRFAKRQTTWFKADPEIQWFLPAEETVPKMEEMVRVFLGGAVKDA